jgi:lipopolysaccharide transport system ATP-binding protein
MKPIIRVQNVSKEYAIGVRSPGADNLREAFTSAVRAPFKHLRRNGAASGKFWALKDINLEVEPGEILGIIGRNGAGKSTLLKILSRITEPTTGRVELFGRLGSLLEVGTGFHPELTGRENIFLNGSILGIGRNEIERKFDEIVSFAEVERFIDTAVKYYSSGMYVRLAFAVAAHLEPEILILDEVLAVGDAEFQKKCLGKMGSVAREGRTVLFVSHNMASIQSLCTRAVLLENGRVVADGSWRDVIRRYLSAGKQMRQLSVAERTDRQGDGSVRLESLSVEASDGDDLLTSTSGLRIKFSYRSNHPLVRPKVLIGLYDENEIGVYGMDTEAVGGFPISLPPHGEITCVTEPLHLTAGRCWINIAIFNGGNLSDYVQRAAEFTIELADFYGTGRTPGRDWMIGLLHHKWTVKTT